MLHMPPNVTRGWQILQLKVVMYGKHFRWICHIKGVNQNPALVLYILIISGLMTFNQSDALKSVL